jgi:hypothetical protein
MHDEKLWRKITVATSIFIGNKKPLRDAGVIYQIIKS